MKNYQVRVTHDPKTHKPLLKPKVFDWGEDKEKALDQVRLLHKDGLTRNQATVHLLEASP